MSSPPACSRNPLPNCCGVVGAGGPYASGSRGGECGGETPGVDAASASEADRPRGHGGAASGGLGRGQAGLTDGGGGGAME